MKSKTPHKLNERNLKRYLQYLSEGDAKYEAAAKIGVSRFAIYLLCKSNPDFSDQVEEAYLAGQELVRTEWLEKIKKETRDGLFEAAEGRHPSVLIFLGKSLLGLKETETIEHTGKDGEPLMTVRLPEDWGGRTGGS